MASNPILVINESSIVAPEIIEYLYPTSYAEGGGQDSEVSMMNTMGKIVPLVKINNKIIEQGDIKSLRLESSRYLPTLSLTFYDRDNITTLIDTPGPDDYIHVQIIPRFDGIYKKINLLFYIKDISMSISKQIITIDAEYTIPGLDNAVLKSYGKLDTYTLYNTISQELGLGFCSNISTKATNDNRYTYITNDTYINSLRKMYLNGGTSPVVLSSWIDLYNNINLIDLYDLYYGGENWSDQPDDIKIYSSHSFNASSAEVLEEPFEIVATLTNDPKYQIVDLYTEDMKLKNNLGKNKKIGTDIGINIYDIDKNIQSSKLIQDSSGVSTNVYTKVIYNGEFNPEVCDNSEYLFQSDAQKLFNNKINNNLIEITTQKVIFGLMRGGKVNVKWYNNSVLGSSIQDKSYMEMNSNLQVEEVEYDVDDPRSMRINKRVSGQYVIVSTEILYNMRSIPGGTDYNMRQKFILSRVVNSEESRYTKTL